MGKCADAAGKSASGYHGGKKVTGRGRHTAADTGGWLLPVMAPAAPASDKADAKILLTRLFDASDTPKADASRHRSRGGRRPGPSALRGGVRAGACKNFF